MKVFGGRGRDRTGDPLLAKHETQLQSIYPRLLTTNVSNKSGNLLLAQSYPQCHENVGFLHSPCTAVSLQRHVYFLFTPWSQFTAFFEVSRARCLTVTMQILFMSPFTCRIIFHPMCIMTRSQDDRDLLTKRSKSDFSQTRARSQPVLTSNR